MVGIKRACSVFLEHQNENKSLRCSVDCLLKPFGHSIL